MQQQQRDDDDHEEFFDVPADVVANARNDDVAYDEDLAILMDGASRDAVAASVEAALDEVANGSAETPVAALAEDETEEAFIDGGSDEDFEIAAPIAEPSPVVAAAAAAPSWSLFEGDELPASDETLSRSTAPISPAPLSGQPAFSEPAEPQASAVFAEPAKPAPVYVAPDLNLNSALANRSLGELATQDERSRELGQSDLSDVATQAPVSKGKIVLVVAMAGIAAALIGGWTLLKPSTASAPVSVNTAPAPTAPPVADVATQAPPTGTPSGPSAPPVGIDVSNTTAIPAVAAEFDYAQQGAPIAPGVQSCELEGLSEFSKKVCKTVGVQRYYSCAPDGAHWDPRIAGCESL